MQAKKKSDVLASGAPKAETTSLRSGVSATDQAASPMTAQSPARALQMRLARELAAPARAWLWHSAGLVSALLLSLSLAGVMLKVGL